MKNDPIVEEMRGYGQAFLSRHDHDLTRILAEFRKMERSLGNRVVQRAPRYVSVRNSPVAKA